MPWSEPVNPVVAIIEPVTVSGEVIVTNIPLSVIVELANAAPVHFVTEFVLKADAPDTATVVEELPLYVNDAIPAPWVKLSKLVPNALPLIVELAKLVFGIADNPNVNVSVPAFPEIVKPCPDEEAKFKLPDGESANKLVPDIDAVAKALGDVANVTYPASLFNCDILLPETTTFFQVAIFTMFYYKYMLI